MKRLFAFGCSLTYYTWPTWADLVSPGFHEYYNFGVMGMGNQFIHHTVYEANSIFDFTPEDTVLVMFSHPFRNDSFIIDKQDNKLRWQSRGFIYQPGNENLYTQNWRDKFWSAEHSYMHTWLAMKSIKSLLESKSVNYKFLQGMSCQNLEQTGPIDVSNHTFIQPYYEQILSMFHVREPLFNWAHSEYSKDTFYVFNGFRDDHPTVKMHGAYVLKNLPDLCNENTVNLVSFLEKEVDLTSQENNWLNPNFSTIRGKKAGSTLNWQYLVTSEVGTETFKN